MLYDPNDNERIRAWTEDAIFGKWYRVTEDVAGRSTGEGHYFIPDYPNDLNAAITLQHEGAHLDLMVIPYRNEAIAAFIKRGDHRRSSVKAENAATAVCLAWLAYMDAIAQAKENAMLLEVSSAYARTGAALRSAEASREDYESAKAYAAAALKDEVTQIAAKYNSTVDELDKRYSEWLKQKATP